MGNLSEHFSRSEFHCTGCTPANPCWRGGVDTVHAALIPVLERVREHFGKPVTVTSGFRCEERNRKVGGAKNSKHLYGMAADIKVSGVAPALVYAFLDEWHEGGLGSYPTFTHVDVRPKRVRF